MSNDWIKWVICVSLRILPPPEPSPSFPRPSRLWEAWPSRNLYVSLMKEFNCSFTHVIQLYPVCAKKLQWFFYFLHCVSLSFHFRVSLSHASIPFQGQFQRVLHGCVLRLLQWAEICGRREECECLFPPPSFFLFFFWFFWCQKEWRCLKRSFLKRGSGWMLGHSKDKLIHYILHFLPQFLDLISTSGQWDQKSIETPIMLKEG